MLRLPAQIDLGPYTLHLDVLAARLARPRRGVRRAAQSAAALLVIVIGVIWAHSFLRGSGVVVLPAHDSSVTVALNGRVLMSTIVQAPTGQHTLRFEQADTFPVEQVIHVTKAQTTTVMLPLFRPIPHVQRLPLPSAQSTWASVSADSAGGWRLGATTPNADATANARPGWGTKEASRVAQKLLHLDKAGITPLTVLETYPIADELIIADGQRFWATWEAQSSPNTNGVVGVLSLATPSGTHVVSTTAELRGVWWSPGGRMLLAALARDQGVDLALLDVKRVENATLTPIITMPGVVRSVHWHPNGRAAVVISAPETGAEDTGTQARPRPTQTPEIEAVRETSIAPHDGVLLRLPHEKHAAEATRLHAPPPRSASIVPLAWSAEDLWWVADTGLGLALERIALANLHAQRIGALAPDIAALVVMEDETVRVVRATDQGEFVVERWPEGERLFSLPTATATEGSIGVWHDGELLLATSSTELWYVQIAPEAVE